MRIPGWLRRFIATSLIEGVAKKREPDFIIGDHYLERWWVIPRNPVFNVYLHKIAKSDDDRALHDHPWWNVSLLLRGNYLEHVPWSTSVEEKRGFVRSYMADKAGNRWNSVIRRTEGELAGRLGRSLHRLEVDEGLPTWTLFITGPRFRKWGFACPQGWRHWKEFTAAHDGAAKGQVGRGCD